MKRTSRIPLLLCYVWVLGVPSAWAQPASGGSDKSSSTEQRPWERTSAADKKQALELFHDANQMTDGGELLAALTLYRRIVAIWPHPAVHYNMAMVLMELQFWLDALTALNEALRWGPDPLRPDEYRDAQERREYLENLLSTLVLSCDIPGAEVRLSGQLLFMGPGQTKKVLMPGEYVVTVDKPGHRQTRRELLLVSGQQVEHALTLQYQDKDRYLPRWAPLPVLASGALLALTGVYFHREATIAFDDYEVAFAVVCSSGCRDFERTDQIDLMLRRAEEQRSRARWMYLASAGVVAAGIALWVANRPYPVWRDALPHSRDDASAWSPEIVPVIGDNEVSVLTRIRF